MTWDTTILQSLVLKMTNTDGTYDVTLKDIVDSKGNSIFDVDKDGNFITSQGPNGQTMYSYKGRAVDPQTIFEDASLVFRPEWRVLLHQFQVQIHRLQRQ